MSLRFAIAAGGTGGHLFPGLAVAEVFHQRGHEVMILTSEKHIDAVATEGRSEFRIERLPGVGLPKGISLETIRFGVRFAKGVWHCSRLFGEFKPQAVLGMGGFTSTAPILAGRLRGLPCFVHESNAIPGKANRLNARLAGGILTGMEECAGAMPGVRCVFTGTPVRRALGERVDTIEARKKFGLDGLRKTLLVMGGSQGARGINQSVPRAVAEVGKEVLQVIHITGKDGEDEVRKAYADAGISAWVGAFHHQMQDAYSAADVTVSRSGAASLTELAYFGVPSVLIPYPYAAEDHQTRNAEVFVKAGAGILLVEKEAGAERLAKHIRDMVEETTHAKMVEACIKLTQRDAAQRVADVVLTAVSGGAGR